MMSSAVKILPHYTYEEYCLWEGRCGLIEGIPYAMSPVPMPRHQWISNNIKYELKNAMKKSAVKEDKTSTTSAAEKSRNGLAMSLQTTTASCCNPISSKSSQSVKPRKTVTANFIFTSLKEFLTTLPSMQMKTK